MQRSFCKENCISAKEPCTCIWTKPLSLCLCHECRSYHTWMSHVTYGWVMSHIWMSLSTYVTMKCTQVAGTWLIHMWNTTHSLRLDTSICETWLVYMWHVIYTWAPSPLPRVRCETWHILTCNMTHSYAPCLSLVCGMTLPHTAIWTSLIPQMGVPCQIWTRFVSHMNASFPAYYLLRNSWRAAGVQPDNLVLLHIIMMSLHSWDTTHSHVTYLTHVRDMTRSYCCIRGWRRSHFGFSRILDLQNFDLSVRPLFQLLRTLNSNILKTEVCGTILYTRKPARRFGHSKNNTDYCAYLEIQMSSVWSPLWVDYGVATISRLLKIMGLFCKRALQKRRTFSKGTYNLKEATNRRHPT